MRRQLVDGLELDDDPARVDLEELHRFLSNDAYWALGRPLETVERLVREAQRVVGLYEGDRLVGFCRAVTDGVSIVYLADVYVLAELRGRGLGMELLREMIENGPYVERKWILHTEDGHGLYEKLGFAAPNYKVMERLP